MEDKLYDALSKRIDSLSDTVKILSKQVIDINELDYKFWIPIIVSVIAAGITIYQTVKGNQENKKIRTDAATDRTSNEEEIKKNRLSIIQSNIDSARAHLESVSLTLAQHTNTADEVTKTNFKSILNSANEALLNKYEDGCNKFFKEQIPQDEFQEIYHQSIITLVENNQDKFDNLTRFNKLLKYYRQHHQQQTT